MIERGTYGFFNLGAVAKYLCCDSLRPKTRFRPSLAGCGPRGIFVWRSRTSWTQWAGNRPVPCPRKTPSRRPQSVAPVTVKNKETKTRLQLKKYFWSLPIKQKSRETEWDVCRPNYTMLMTMSLFKWGKWNIMRHRATLCHRRLRSQLDERSTFCWICLVVYLQGCLLDW